MTGKGWLVMAPTAARRAARNSTETVPAQRAASQDGAQVIAGVTTDDKAAKVAARPPKVTKPAPASAAGTAQPRTRTRAVATIGDAVAAAVAGNLTLRDESTLTEDGKGGPFKSGSVGFFATAKTLFDGQNYQITCNVIRIGSNPESPKYDPDNVVTASLAEAAVQVSRVLPGALTPTGDKPFTSGKHGFRINGRMAAGEPGETYVVLGQVVAYTPAGN